MIKRNDMINKIAEGAGVKKSDARKMLDVFLEETRKSLLAGEPVILPPMGKLVAVTRNEGKENERTLYKLNLKSGDEDNSGAKAEKAESAAPAEKVKSGGSASKPVRRSSTRKTTTK